MGRPKTAYTPARRKHQKRCSASIHVISATSSKIYHTRHKKLKSETLEALIQKGIIQRRSAYICEQCIDKGTRSEQVQDTQELTDSSEIVDAQESYSATPSTSTRSLSRATQPGKSTIKGHPPDYDERQIYLDIGKKLSKMIETDIKEMKNIGSNAITMDSLQNYSPSAWLEERPNEVIALISSLLNCDSNESEKDNILVAKVVELIYKGINSRIVLPLSFRENILSYAASYSKKLVNYNGQTSAGGSYTYLLKWLSEQASEPPTFPLGFAKGLLDNEQVIGKTHTVRAENKVPMTVLTSHAYLSIDTESTIQKEKPLRPSEWLYQDVTSAKKQEVLNFGNQYANYFRTTRNAWINHCLEKVMEEHKESVTCDHIDVLLEKQAVAAMEKICIECGGSNDLSSRTCTNCKGRLIKQPVELSSIYPAKADINPYEHFKNFVERREKEIKVVTGEPDFLNPNSYNNISEILTNLGTRAGIKKCGGEEREWLLVEVDGGIYPIIEQLVANVWFCARCDNAYYGEDTFLDHSCAIVHNEVPHEHYFDWIVLTPGLLHWEMNACKAYMKLNWDVFIMSIFQGQKFVTSTKALEYMKKCSSHHKSWKFLEILYVALSEELMVPFVRHAIEKNGSITAEDYWKWTNSVNDPNYIYVQNSILTFLHALMLFRSGVRNGDHDAILAGQYKFSPLFYGRNHPRYQKIIATDTKSKVLMPEELQNAIYQSLSGSRTGHTGHYQGGDACLEEINKEAKAWIPQTGVPTNKQWLRVFRNMDKLIKIREDTLAAGSGQDKDKDEKETQLVALLEVSAVRSVLRKQKYLMQPYTFRAHMDVTGTVPLADQLVNFTEFAERLQSEYLQNFLEKKELKINAIPVTKEEEEEKRTIASKTKQDIKKEIFKLLEKLDEGNRKLQEEFFRNSVQKKQHADYVAFYKQIEMDLDEQI